VRARPPLVDDNPQPGQAQTESDPLKPWSGIAPVLQSGYLLGICAYLFLYAFTSSFIYFQRQELVADSFGARADRVKFLSDLNLYGSVATVLVQLFLTGRLIARLGLVFSLALVPAATCLGFAFFALQPALMLLALFEVTRKTLNFAIARPSREVLFTVVKKEDKYLAKNFIDTFVYRAGDTLASLAFEALKLGLNLGTRGLSLAAVPCSLLWLLVAAALAMAQRRKQSQLEAPVWPRLGGARPAS
jgi:AAA family ATP:ADP antiporter